MTSIPFIEAAGGDNAKIAVLGLGGDQWNSYFKRVYKDRWESLGVKEVISIIPNKKMKIEKEKMERINECSGLLICGGDTRAYQKVYVNSSVAKFIREFYLRGKVFAGVSAGALISTNPCTIWGSKVSKQSNEFVVRSHFNNEELLIDKGIGVLRNCIVEPHFSEYGGFPRLIEALEQTNEKQGLGIDEPICLEIINEKDIKVHGRGRVYFISRYKTLEFKVKVYEPGDSFSLE
ncbi:cyanophycinase [Lederbergia citrea]|uniref:cyanophycinase n=1 Tax=Lederbergia citrea TaxID=2833581 RepID=UPI001BC954A0|nr:cyanophycinase [Lederbergia citrea]MBS4203649.1 cyanophycinase [Lederbergia citrea]